MGVQSGADGGTAQVDLRDQLRGFLQPLGVLGDHDGVRAEFLAQGHRYRVLQLRAAHLEHAAELVRLGQEGGGHLQHRGVQGGDVHLECNLHRRGIDVVGALAAIDVFERMQSVVVPAAGAEYLERSVGDHLVGVHVGGRARAALDDVDDELVVQFTVADLGAGRLDRGGTLVIEQTEFPISPCGSLFHCSQGVDELWIRAQRDARNGEVRQGARGVYAVVGQFGNLAAAQRIVLTTG